MVDYYIDLGSSTIKVYKYEDKVLTLIDEHSIHFKNDFDSIKGLSEINRKDLFEYFQDLKTTYNLRYENTHIFATGIFRSLCYEAKRELVTYFNDSFDLHFDIISHGIENYYIGKAMENDYSNKKVMIINMGGKTTELITFENNKITDRMNINTGVGELISTFPNVNDSLSTVTIEEINDFVKEKIKDIKFDIDYDCAIFTGGEERWQKLTKYNIVPNTLFDDGIHKYMISYDDYISGSQKAFFEITMEELYNLMPKNPKWMDGARPGAILPVAIFDMAKIDTIIPSDLNLINGVINDID